ncbi:DUF5908 family protein [Parvimonas sp. D4]|uniref:DUF5908 family protein n=1 Tax=Parvimonas sp. D4 TaxID=3110690 RepID=UPI002B48CC24|nr:DUF5908 family protein [Parvimonas sp. D4]
MLMPLEIRELVIKVNVRENERQTDDAELNKKIQEMKTKIVKECMEKLLSRIESLNTR